MDDLSQIWDQSDSLRETAARHEAGHACFALEVAGWECAAPIFTEVQIETKPNDFGVVQGRVALVPSWARKLAPIDKAAILLGGWYAQEGHTERIDSGEQLRKKCIDKFYANTDCTDDISRILEIEPNDLSEQSQFWDLLLARGEHLWLASKKHIEALSRALLTYDMMSYDEVRTLLRDL